MRLLAGAGECDERFLRQVRGPHGVIFRVGNIERLPIRRKRQALRLMQLCFCKRSVGESDLAGPDYVGDLSVHRCDHHAVMVRVADEQPFIRYVGEHFARKLELAGFEMLALGVEVKRLGERAVGFALSQQLIDFALEQARCPSPETCPTTSPRESIRISVGHELTA